MGARELVWLPKEGTVARNWRWAMLMMLGLGASCDKFTPPTLPPAATGPAPETTLTGGPRARTRLTQFTAQLASNETSASFLCSLDSEAFAPCTSPVIRTGLAGGVHVFRAFAVLPDGRFDATPASLTWEVVAIALETTLTSVPPAATATSTALFAFTSNEGTATFECWIDNDTPTACTSPLNIASLSSGTHRFHVRAVDGEGVKDDTPAEYSWSIDATAPTVTITRAPTDIVEASSYTFNFSANDETSRLYCKLDTGAAAPCTSPYTVSGLAPGAHQFSVYAIDAAGNRASPVNAAFVVQWAQGTTCAAAADCRSGFCVDGVCCGEACTGVCRSCALTRGQCTAVRNAIDPDTCSGTNRCDDNGACGVSTAPTDGFELSSSRFHFKGQFPDGQLEQSSSRTRFSGKVQVAQ